MNHIYDAGRCIFCNANSLDVSIYQDDERCDARDPNGAPYSYTSESLPSRSGLPASG